MLNLAIAVDIDRKDRSIIETNSGKILVSPNWPQDYESQVVAYHKGSRNGYVIDLEELTEDIREMLALHKQKQFNARRKPDWLVRLERAAAL